MSTIDERIVSMKFNNSQFGQGVKTTMGLLDTLKLKLNMGGATKGLDDIGAASGRLSQKMKFDGATKGLENINTAAKNVQLSHLGAAVDNISSKFSALSVVGVTALATLVSSATSAGVQMAKSLTLQPATEGFGDYELKIGATQNIMAGTGEDIDTVTTHLKDLDIYADKTIYNLRDMTSNIGKFTNAGVKLPVAVGAMKGIANVAALSGANTEEASRAMYNLGQAIGQGSVKLMDWKSVELANMGTMEFKQQLMDSAVAMGTLKKGTDGVLRTTKGTEVTTKNFSTTLADQWLTADALTKTLGNYSSETTAIGKKAWKAASEVKSFSMMTTTLKASMGTGWTDTFDILVGDLPEATKMWTNTTGAISKIINKSADSRNKLMGEWDKAGGRTAVIAGITAGFHALIAVAKPIKDAFHNIFPAKTGKDLADLSVKFLRFTRGLMIGGDTARKLNRTFSGVFAIFSIGWEIIKRVTKMFSNLFGSATKGSGGILDFTAKVGDFLIKVEHAVKKGEGFSQFFEKLEGKLAIPIRLIRQFAGFISKAFSGFGNVDVGGIDKLKDRFEPLGRLGTIIANVWARVAGFFSSAWAAFRPIADKFSSFFDGFGETIKKGFAGIDYNLLLDAINTGLFAGLLLMLKKFMKDGLKIGVSSDIGGGMLDSIKKAFGGLTDTMKAMQTNLKAGTLMKIAIAIGILTLSVVALSLIDSAALTKALMAMTVMFTQLMTSMQVLEKGSTVKGSAKIAVMAGAMILLAIAVDILAIAVTKLAKLSWEELKKGLAGVGALLAALVAASKTMSGNNKNMVSTGIGLGLMAVAIRILVGAVEDLSKLSWEDLKKGLVGVGAILASLALFTQLSAASKGGVAQGAGLILLALGMKILVGVVKDFAVMSWEEIGKGLATMSGALAAIGAALLLIPPSAVLSAVGVIVVATALGLVGKAIQQMGTMDDEVLVKGLASMSFALLSIAAALALLPPSSLLSAVAILIVAASLKLIVEALGTMGGMSWEEIGKSLALLAGALIIIAVAVTAMILALPGAIALVIVAGALAILAPILLLFGKMSWEEIAKGLAMLAGVLVIIGVAGALLTPVIPTLIGLGIAITLFGVGILAAGVGLLAFSAGLTALALTGAVGVAAIVAIVTAVIALIPMLMMKIGEGVIAFALVIAAAGPAITGAITTVLMSLMNAIITLTPKIVETLGVLLTGLIGLFVEYIPKFVNAGMKLLLGFLKGIKDNIGQVVTEAASIVVNFLKALAKKLPDIISAGTDVIIAFIKGLGKSALDIAIAAADTLITFINGLSKAVDDKAEEMGTAAGKLAVSLIAGIKNGLGAAVREIAKSAGPVGGAILNSLADALGAKSPSTETYKFGVWVVEGLINGFNDHSGDAVKTSENVGHDTINAMKKSITGISDLITGDMDMHPTIAPILDLTDVKNNSGMIGSMLSTKPIAVDTTFSKAADISAKYGSVQPVPVQTLKDIQALTTVVAAKPITPKDQPAPRPVEFHIGTVEDGDTLLRRARANDRMLSLAEGGDSTQMNGLGI